MRLTSGFRLCFLSNMLLRRALEVVQFHQISHAHLRRVVDDELAVAQAATLTMLSAAKWQLRTPRLIKPIGPIRLIVANSPSAVGAGLRLLHVDCPVAGEHVSQGNITKQHVHGFLTPHGGIGAGLLEHVCKVDALSEHVALHWRLRWGHPQALGQDADEVGAPGAVPQQPSVPQVLEPLRLPVAGDPIDPRDRVAAPGAQEGVLPLLAQRLRKVPGFGGRGRIARGGGHVIHQCLELGALRVHPFKGHAHRLAAVIQGIHRLLPMPGSQQRAQTRRGFSQIDQHLKLLGQGIVTLQGPCHLGGPRTPRHQLKVARGQLQDPLAHLVPLLRGLEHLLRLGEAELGRTAGLPQLLQLRVGCLDLPQEVLGLIQRSSRQTAEGHGLCLDTHGFHRLQDMLGVANAIQRSPKHVGQTAPGTNLRVEGLHHLLAARGGAAPLQQLVLVRLPLEAGAGIPHIARLLLEDLPEVLHALLLAALWGALEHPGLSDLAPAGEEHEEVLVGLVDQLEVVEAHLIALQVHLEEERVVLLALRLRKDPVLPGHAIGLVHGNPGRLCLRLHSLQLLPGVRVHVTGLGRLQLNHLHGHRQLRLLQHRSHAPRALALRQRQRRQLLDVHRLGRLAPSGCSQHGRQQTRALIGEVGEWLDAVVQRIPLLLVLMAGICHGLQQLIHHFFAVGQNRHAQGGSSVLVLPSLSRARLCFEQMSHQRRVAQHGCGQQRLVPFVVDALLRIGPGS
mmetsp:Transcript_24605/g.58382  ORF Transcript_24605/g.58382 Transcript_24605/m.58382 type:complete len:734 (+) Transcript_24605:265-2466(+)